MDFNMDGYVSSEMEIDSLCDSNDEYFDDTQFLEDFELSEIPKLAELNDVDFDLPEYIKSLSFELRNWAIKNNIKQFALTELLKILKNRGHSSLPKDARTLLKTPQKVGIVRMGAGQYWYRGLRNKLTEICKKNDCGDVIELTFHIDGTPVYKNSKSEFWPVQCDIKGVEMKAFFASIYQGKNKPTSAEQFLRPLLDEIHDLLETGLSFTVNGVTKTHLIRVDKFILDAPARAFLKCIIGHSGYSSRERCEERGEYLRKEGKQMKPAKGGNSKRNGHVCLIGINATLRTDESFRNQYDQDHHHDNSPLEELPIDIVRDIPLEYLHLILYGCMKRLLNLWVQGTKHFKFSEKDIYEISAKLQASGVTKPSEINIPNRSLHCLSFWKATEFRTFLLKTGPVVLRGHLTEQMYNHFLALHCAVTICSSEALKRYVPVAKSLFRTFTERFGDLYGDCYRTYSVHSIIHVTDDVERFGVLDKYSAFPGESNLGFLKNLVRGGHLPLEQVARRIIERDLCEKICEFENSHGEEREGLRKGILRVKGIRLDDTEKNRWILTKNLEIFKIASISNSDNMFLLHGSILAKENQENLYELPFTSKNLLIFQSKLNSTPISVKLEDMFCKFYRIELSSETSAFFPLFHFTQ